MASPIKHNLPHAILFDLDGTLADPEPGITNCIRYALRELGQPDQTNAALRWCIGPPLQESFARLLASDDPTPIAQAVALYRQRFDERARFECTPYPGIHAALAQLRAAEVPLFVATSKLEHAADALLSHFDLREYFVRVYGSQSDGARGDKIGLVRHLIAQEQLHPRQTWMVGDRIHDIRGGKANGLWTAGVTYGYGAYDELAAATPHRMIASPADLPAALLSPPG